MLKPASKPFEGATTITSIDSPGVYLLGFEFDGTACFRKGTALGPNDLRDISFGIESYSPYLDQDLDDFKFYDLGNLDLGSSEHWQTGNKNFLNLISTEKIKKDISILTLGGEHSISYAPIKRHLEAYSDLVLLHLDAHADLRDGYEGYHYSHASIIRRALDNFQGDHQLIQYGIRSGTKEEYEWMRKNKTLKTSLDDFIEAVQLIDSKRPIYLTLDLDYFDPSFFPGTGTPEPGGEDFHSFIKLIKVLMKKNFVGADIVELSPPIDATGNSSVFAAKVVRETIMALNKSLIKGK